MRPRSSPLSFVATYATAPARLRRSSRPRTPTASTPRPSTSRRRSAPRSPLSRPPASAFECQSLAAYAAIRYILTRSGRYRSRPPERAEGGTQLAFVCGGPPASRLRHGVRHRIVPNARFAPACRNDPAVAGGPRASGQEHLARGFIEPPATAREISWLSLLPRR